MKKNLSFAFATFLESAIKEEELVNLYLRHVATAHLNRMKANNDVAVI